MRLGQPLRGSACHLLAATDMVPCLQQMQGQQAPGGAPRGLTVQSGGTGGTGGHRFLHPWTLQGKPDSAAGVPFFAARRGADQERVAKVPEAPAGRVSIQPVSRRSNILWHQKHSDLKL